MASFREYTDTYGDQLVRHGEAEFAVEALERLGRLGDLNNTTVKADRNCEPTNELSVQLNTHTTVAYPASGSTSDRLICCRPGRPIGLHSIGTNVDVRRRRALWSLAARIEGRR